MEGTFHNWIGTEQEHFIKEKPSIGTLKSKVERKTRFPTTKGSHQKKTGMNRSGWPIQGGGVTPPPAWPILFVKSLGLFSYWIWFLDTQNRFYFIVKRLKNAFLMYFYCLFNCPKTAKTLWHKEKCGSLRNYLAEDPELQEWHIGDADHIRFCWGGQTPSNGGTGAKSNWTH